MAHMAADYRLDPNSDSTTLVEQLRQSLGLLRVAFDATGEAMLILDDQRCIRWVNRQAADDFGGGSSLRVIGRQLDSILIFRHLDQRPLVTDDPHHPLNQVVHGEEQTNLLVEIIANQRSSPSRVLQRMVSWRPIVEMNSEFTLLIFRDLDPLERALQQQRSFINRLAHELRTPLAIMNGNLRRLSRKSFESQFLLQSLDDLRSETLRMTGLVNKLLLLSELDTDRYQWHLETRNLSTFLLHWLDSLTPHRRSLVQLRLPDASAHCVVELDQRAMCQIFDNLLENSLRFASGGGKLDIQVRVHQNNLDLIVSDQGPSLMLNEDASLLFERFTRLEEHRDPSRSDGDGIGLGLALVKSLVEGMGGSVTGGCNVEATENEPHGLQVCISFQHSN